MASTISTSALRFLASTLRNYMLQKEAEKLAAERTAAAYGDEARPDMAIINPVGAGIDK